MNSRAILLTVCSALTLLSCEKQAQEGGAGTGQTVLPLSIEQGAAKTWIDSDVQGRSLPVYWSAGDVVYVNGQQSAPLEIAPGTKLSNAEFKLRSVSAPYSVIYPASIVTGEAFDAEGKICVTLPSSQLYDASTFASGSAILYGYGRDEGEAVWMQNLCAAVRVSLKGDTDDTISAAQISSQTGLSGDFTLNPATGELLPVEARGTLALAIDTPVSISGDGADFWFAVPAGDYGEGVTVTFTRATDRRKMICNWTPDALLEPGKVYHFKDVTFVAGAKDIETAQDWEEFALAVNEDGDLSPWTYADGKVRLGADIEAEDLTAINTFAGHLDAQGHSITRSGATAPLVATLAGTISNLNILGSFAQAPFQGSPLVNVLSGGTIENCTNHMDLASDVTSDHVMLGGIVRLVNAGTVKKCSNYGNITASIDVSSGSYNMQCGGIVAQLYPDADQTVTIEDCCNYGKISAVPYFETTGHNNSVTVGGLGGVVGWVRYREGTNVVLDNCDNSGEVFYSAEHVSSPDGTKATAINVGGIAGLAARMEVSGSLAGILSTPTGANGLNIVLRGCDNSAKVYNCGVNYSNGAQAGNKSFTGGLVGSIVGNLANFARFENCTNTGDVQTYDLTGPDSNARPAYCAVVGGMVGFGAYLNFNGCTVNCKIGGGKRPVASISGLIGFCVNKFNVTDCTIFCTGYFQRVSGFSGNRSIVATVPVKYSTSAMGIVPDVQGSTITGCKLGAKVRTNTNTLSSDTKEDLLSSGYNVTIPASVSATGDYLVCGNGFTTNSGVTLSGNTYWEGN